MFRTDGVSKLPAIVHATVKSHFLCCNVVEKRFLRAENQSLSVCFTRNATVIL